MVLSCKKILVFTSREFRFFQMINFDALLYIQYYITVEIISDDGNAARENWQLFFNQSRGTPYIQIRDSI